MQTKNKILISLSLLFLQSCTYIIDLKRTGEVKSNEIAWIGAPSIEVLAPCKIILLSSDSPFIKVEGMDFIIDGYEFIQTDNQLKIDHNNVSWLQEEKMANITLGSPYFENIVFNSPGKLYTKDTLHINQFRLTVNGKGIYTTSDLVLKGNKLLLNVYGGINKSSHRLSGEVTNAQYTLEGGTDIDALNLKTKNTSVVHKSYGNLVLNAQTKLTGEIYSTGNIYYVGNPQIKVETIKNAVMLATGKVSPY